MAITSVTILTYHSWFLLQPGFAPWEERAIYNFFLICFWSMSVYGFLFIIYIPKQCYELSRSLLDHGHVYLGSLRICFGKEDVIYSFLRRGKTLQSSKFWLLCCELLQTPFFTYLTCSIFLYSCYFWRKQTLLVKPDEELLQPHFLFVRYYSFIEVKKRYFENVISDICIRKHGLTVSCRVFKFFQGKDL